MEEPRSSTTSRVSAYLHRLGDNWALVAQAALLFLLILFLVPQVLRDHGLAYSDEGLYAAQTSTLATGHWDARRPAPDLPDVADLNGIGPEWTHGDRYIGYVRHSTYIRLLVPFWNIGGFGGLLIPSALGGALAALSSALLARRLSLGLASPTLWITGLGTPLIFDSLLIAAHTLAAAACGWVAVGLALVLLDRRYRHLIWCLPLTGITVLLRSEGTLAMLAMGIAIGLVALVQFRRSPRGALVTAGLGIAVIATAAAAYFLDAELARQLTGTAARTQTIERFGGEREYLPQVWISLFRPWYSEMAPQPVVALGSAGVVLSALLARLVGRRHPFIPVAVLSAATICLAYEAPSARWLMTGLFAAAPLLLAGLFLLRRSDVSQPLVATSLLTLAFFATGLVATGYSEGGAAEWGGRFYAVILPLLVPIAIMGLSHLRELGSVTAGRVAIACMVVVSLAMATMAVGTNRSIRSNSREFSRATMSAVHSLSRSKKPLLIIGGTAVGGTSRALWDQRRNVDVLVGPSITAMFGLVRHAAKHRYREAFLVTMLRTEQVDEVARAWLDPVHWHQTGSVAVGDTGWRMYAYGPRST